MSTDTATTTRRAEVTTLDAAGNPLADIYVGAGGDPLLAAIERGHDAIADRNSRVAAIRVVNVLGQSWTETARPVTFTSVR